MKQYFSNLDISLQHLLSGPANSNYVRELHGSPLGLPPFQCSQQHAGELGQCQHQSGHY